MMDPFLEKDFDSSKITKQAIKLADKLRLKHCDSKNPAFILRNCLSNTECSILIEKAEQGGFSPAPVNLGGTDIIEGEARSGSRYIYDDEPFVSTLWERIKGFIPTSLKGGKVIGLNERLRFLRYHPGEKFAPHYDGTFSRPENSLEVSLITLQIYLNEGFEGGETAFLGDDDETSSSSNEDSTKVPIIPETGMILVFEQDLMHEGAVLKSGVKYTIRTDVMYSYG